MNIFDITQFKNGIPKEKVEEEITHNDGRIIIDYEMSSINRSNSHIDITWDYLEASYIAEELGKHSKTTKAQLVSKYPHPPICRFEFIVNDVGAFTEVLTRLSIALYCDEVDDFDRAEYLEELDSYAASLDGKLFLCPDLVDGYYANLVGAADIELDAEEDGYLQEDYKKHPEREFGFWKSAYSRTIGDDFYVSRECWVVPLSIDIQRLLSGYSELSSIETYEEAVLFGLKDVSYLVNQHGVVYFPFSPFLDASRFTQLVLRQDDIGRITLNENILTYSPIDDDIEERWNIDLHENDPQVKYLLSHSNLSIIVEDGSFRYVFFPNQLKPQKKWGLYQQVSELFGLLGDYAGVSKEINLSWDDFDDEKFEELCYDILYHNPQYDNETIRKMGKSRSRDGGRDIEIYTRERFGKPKKKFIFQCKFTKTGSSLTTAKVGNISDTVAQYAAQGYGVMAPVVIDAALYDRIDAVCTRFDVESNNWSLFEIERFIARHPNIKARHFKK